MFVFIQQKGPDGRPMTRLMGESAPMMGRILKLEPPRVVVGKAEDCDIRVPLAHIAPHHFELTFHDNQVTLRDRSEGLGTLVNDEPISETTLTHGMRIGFAQATSPQETGHLQVGSAPSTPHIGIGPGSERSILLSERSIGPVFDDVRSVMGAGASKWGASKHRPPAPKLHPPGGVQVATLQPPENWQQRKLEVLLAVGKALSRPEEIEQKVFRVLDLLFETMDIDRAAILVLGQDDKPEEATSFVWSAYRDRQGPTDTMELSSTIIDKVLKESVAVMTQDAQAEDWLDGARSILGQAIRTCICTPLKTANSTLGVLYADSSRTSSPFSQSDMEFFTAFSNQAAIAIENARLLRLAIERERLEQDLRVARRIQRSLYPKQVPHLPGYSLAGDSIAMDDVGGDYFDYVPLDEHHVALVVGDVSGHGISAALIMTMTRSILRASLQFAQTPGDVLLRVNQLVSEDMITRMFVTMLLLILDTRTGMYVYANAGHNAPIQYFANQRTTAEIEGAKGGPLGMSRWARLKPKYENTSGQLQPGDALCLYTDGFTEATNAQGELLEMQRFQHAISGVAHQDDAKHAITQLFDSMHQFRGDAPVTDDTTAILLKRNLQ
jgi:serine phosphatase RsbU (regulator of sigma subunit)